MKQLLITIFFLMVPTLGHGATYYVAKTGSNTNSCAQAGSQATPKLTINSGLSCLSAGDTLYVKSGTYAEEITNPPGGTSWNSPVTIAAFPGDTVTIRPNAGATRVFNFASSKSSYIIVDGFILDGTNATHGGIKITWSGASDNYSRFIRIKNSEVKNAQSNGILVNVPGNNEFINLDVHHNGKCWISSRADCWGGPAPHGFYLAGTGHLIDGSNIHENAGGGVQVYKSGGGADNITVRNNAVWGNGTAEPAVGLVLGSGSGHLAYNNIVWGNPRGIKVDFGASNVKVYNNTSYNNNGYCIYIGSGAGVTEVRNNVCYQNRSGITNNGSGTVLADNLITNPLFVNAANGNFKLQAGSPAIDTGATLSQVSNDYEGVSRPQGAGFDIGAYEYVGTGEDSTPLLPPTKLTVHIE